MSSASEIDMEIRRIDAYDDPRFPQTALFQHGAFLVDGEPVWIEITSESEAVVHGQCCPQLLDEFRFYAEHITAFFDEHGALAAQFPKVELFDVELSRIQPSQFYVDEEKLRAVQSFVHSGRDVIVPLTEFKGRYVSLDGHTRLYAALRLDAKTVRGFLTQADEVLFDFVREAQSRGVYTPMDLQLLPHEEYCTKWHAFCDEFLAEREQCTHQPQT